MAKQARTKMLSMATMCQMGDGYVGRSVDRELGVIQKDLIERPTEKKVRTLVVTYTFQNLDSGHVKVAVKTKTTLPVMIPPDTVMKMNEDAGALMFNPDCSENPDQMTIADIDVPG